MNVLMISGDQRLVDGHERLQLQKDQVEQLDIFSYQGVMSAARGFFEVMRAASRVQYDVITAQEPFFRGLLAFMAARRARARLNVQVHTDLAHEPLLKRILARFVLRRADSVRAVSQRLAEQVRELAPRARVFVLPIYIDEDKFRSIERVPDQRNMVLWIGRFELEKNPLCAIEVFRKVRDMGIDARLVMLGSGSLERELRAVATGLPVEFPGWRDTLPYLAEADVVVSTSRFESYGASIVEALAAGVPVVAPDVGIAREAGAIIASRERLAEEAARVLRSGARGKLKLSLPSAEEWAKRWKETLL